MTDSTKTHVHETTVELVHLDNGDIALRRADLPEQPMVVIKFSDISLSLLTLDKMEIARAMVEAGIQRFGQIQSRRMEEAREAAEQGMLH